MAQDHSPDTRNPILNKKTNKIIIIKAALISPPHLARQHWISLTH